MAHDEKPLELASRPAQKPPEPRRAVQRPPKPKPPPDASARLARAWARHPIVAFAGHRGRIAFYRQFHSLVKAGTGMPIALAELSRYASGRMASALSSVAKDLENGAGLGEAMAKHEALFDDATLELLVFAEETGSLERVLAQIVEHLEAMQKLRWTALFGALWPMYLAGAFVFVGPLYGVATCDGNYGATYLSGLGQNLVVAGGSLAIILAFPFLLALAGLERGWDRLKLAMPIAGGATRRIYASRFLLALGTSVSAGLEVARSIRVSGKATGSPALMDRVALAERRVQGGGSLTDGVETLQLLDRHALGTLSVAERTGTLDESLAQLAKETQEGAVRAIRILILIVLAVFAIVVLVMIVSTMLGTLFGPVKEYYELQNQIE